MRNFGVKTVRGQVPIRQAWVDVDSLGRPVAVHAELDLDGHGAETAVVLAISPSHGRDSVAAHAATAFDRRELGIRAPRVPIGRRTDVTIAAVLRPA